jgi:hypothetical protein
MDLNELLYAHQLAVMNIGTAGMSTDELAAKVALYVMRIEEMRNFDTAVEKNEPNPDLAKAALRSWESEGGALVPPEEVLPAGITMILRPEYHVGSYAYSDLASAKAEHKRQGRFSGSGLNEHLHKGPQE